MANWGLICDPCPGNTPTCDGIYVEIPGHLLSNNQGFATILGICHIRCAVDGIAGDLAFVVEERQDRSVFLSALPPLQELLADSGRRM